MARTKAQRRAGARFLQAAGGRKRKVDIVLAPVETTSPTPERMAKLDAPIKTESGAFIVEDLLDRLYRQRGLDTDPSMNARMYDAGKLYRETTHSAGLSGIAAQDLTRVGGGGGDAAHSMPGPGLAAVARLRWRKFWALMGGNIAPAVHGLLVEGRTPEDVGKEHTTYRAATTATAAALTILRIGLWTLASTRP
jgi:hypothetical protein